MASSYHDRHGVVPHLYDTSTSTTDDSHSSGPRSSRHERLIRSPISSSNNNNDPPGQRNNDSTSYPSREHLSAQQRKVIPKIRKAASDTGGYTTGGYDMKMQRYIHSKQTATASPRMRSNLQLEDQFNHEQISFQNRATKQPRRVGSLEQKTTSTSTSRESIRGGMGRNNTYTHHRSDDQSNQNGQSSSSYRALKSRYIDLAVQSRKESMQRYGDDPDQSFESHVETPPKASVLTLKRQLWPDDETMQLGQGPKRALGQGLERGQRVSHSLSPSRRDLNDTHDSDTTRGTANFKTKYYQAALMAAREREDQAARNKGDQEARRSSHIRHEPPPRIRRNAVVERPRTSSGGDESSVPFDERGRTRSKSVPRGRTYPSSLNMPSLQSSNKAVERMVSKTESRGHHGSRSSSMTGTRNQRNTAFDFGREQHAQVHASPSIQQRVEEFSRDSRERSPPRSRSYHVRTFSPEPRSGATQPLVRSPGDGRILGNTATKDSAGVHSHGPSMFKDPIRRFTPIKDCHTPQSPQVGRRPRSPPAKVLTPHETQKSNRPEVDSSRLEHSAVASFWQERTRVSPDYKLHKQDTTVPFSSRSPDSKPSVGSPEGGYRSSEAGSSFPDQQHVAELVAKLSAVDRADPSKALAQIDSILRQESRSNSAEGNSGKGSSAGQREMSSSKPFEDNNHDTESEDDSNCDDDTTVSSITNPTYQVVSNDGFATPDSKSGKPANPFTVSTSAFRPPRPSSLKNYSHTHESQTGKSANRVLAPSDNAFHTPPISIKIQDEQLSPPFSHDRVAGNVREQQRDWPFDADPNGAVNSPSSMQVTGTPRQIARRSPPPPSASHRSETRTSVIYDESIREGRVPKVSTAKPQQRQEIGGEEKKIDPAAHDTRTGAERAINNTSHERHYQSRTLPTLTKWQQAHPWETEIPLRVQKIDVRETSMEDAAGLEVNIAQRYAMNELQRSPLSPRVVMSPKSQHARHIKSPIHERALLEAFPDDPAVMFDPRLHAPGLRKESARISEGSGLSRQFSVPTPDASPHMENYGSLPTTRSTPRKSQRNSWNPNGDQHDLFPDVPLGVEETSSKLPDSPLNPFSSSSRTPSPAIETNPFMSRRHDDGGSFSQASRVSSGSHTPSAETPEYDVSYHRPHISSPRQDPDNRDFRSRRDEPVDLDTSVDTSVSELSGYARNQVPPSRQIPNGQGLTEVARGAVEVTWLSESDGHNTSRDSGRSGSSGGMVGQMELPRPSDNNSRRRFLRGFKRHEGKRDTRKGVKETNGLAPANSARATPQIHLQPVMPAYYEAPPSSHDRSRGESSTPSSRQRSRSSSLERFRSTNMAQKFGRVMRLYDDQD